MSSTAPACRTVTVVAFRGDRSRPFAAAFQQKLQDEKHGRGPGPTPVECLLFAGHTGVSTDDGTTVHGFNPDGTGLAVWQLMEALKNGDAFAGIVTDDTAVFSSAATHGLTLVSFEVILPDPRFLKFRSDLDAERRASQYSYGFPNGDGDCNCTT